MKNILLFLLCILPLSMFASSPEQDWTRVSCSGKNHTVIYNQIMSKLIEPLGADVGYDDGHQFKAYVEVPTDNCYEVIHIIDVVIYDGYFLYYIDQSISFGNEMKPCIDEVRSQVEILDFAFQNIFDLPD